MPEPHVSTGTLYVVATPLGHLEDLTLRAIRVLGEVSLVACEDTRRTATLLRSQGIATATTSYFEHNERHKGERRSSRRCAPGATSRSCRTRARPGSPTPATGWCGRPAPRASPSCRCPGPSAATAALSVSGLPTDRFLFVGFLPAKAGARRSALAALAAERPTLVIFESPVRVVESLSDMLAALGRPRGVPVPRGDQGPRGVRARPVVVAARAARGARERQGRDRAGRVRRARGGAVGRGPGRALRRLAAEGRTRREAVKEAARRLGRPAREVYALVQEAGEQSGRPSERAAGR